MRLIETEKKNSVLKSMERILDKNRAQLLDANKKDLDAFIKDDQAMYDRLLMNDKKINGMIQAIIQVRSQEDPINRVITDKLLENGLQVVNKTAPFGTIMIILP